MNEEISRLRVLIVEDQEKVRGMLKDVLKAFGISQIYEYKSAEEALPFLSKSYDFVDIVLCDWIMGEMSGLKLLQKVRDLGIETPFLMVSGRSDKNAILTARKNGVSGYILKPFSPEQLEAKLHVLLQKVKVSSAA